MRHNRGTGKDTRDGQVHGLTPLCVLDTWNQTMFDSHTVGQRNRKIRLNSFPWCLHYPQFTSEQLTVMPGDVKLAAVP